MLIAKHSTCNLRESKQNPENAEIEAGEKEKHGCVLLKEKRQQDNSAESFVASCIHPSSANLTERLSLCLSVYLASFRLPPRQCYPLVPAGTLRTLSL